MSEETRTMAVIVGLIVAVVVCITVGAIYNMRSDNETLRACLSMGKPPTECAVLVGRGR